MSNGCSLLTPRGQRWPSNLTVNPTQGRRDETAAWESFRGTGCRKKRFPAASDSVSK